jgi:flagellar L-ring protein precursor FlgH
MKFAFSILTLALASALPAQSLWLAPGSREASLVADPKASRVGDIVTIVINEATLLSSSSNKSTSSTSGNEGAVSQFLFPSSVSRFGTFKGEMPGIGFNGKSDYAGGGKVNNSQVVTGRAAVLIADVLPNGNLVIEGVRRVSFSGETQHVVLRGVIRPADISPSNTILSTNIAEARLEFLSEGELSDAQKRGWLSKLYEFLRPF